MTAGIWYKFGGSTYCFFQIFNRKSFYRKLRLKVELYDRDNRFDVYYMQTKFPQDCFTEFCRLRTNTFRAKIRGDQFDTSTHRAKPETKIISTHGYIDNLYAVEFALREPSALAVLVMIVDKQYMSVLR